MASLEVDSDGDAAGDIADANDDDGADAEAADSGRGRRYPSIVAINAVAWCQNQQEMSRSNRKEAFYIGDNLPLINGEPV